MNIYQQTFGLMLVTMEIQMMKKKCSFPFGNLQSSWTDEISSMKHYGRVQESVKCQMDRCWKNPDKGKEREAGERKGFLEVLF